MPVLVRALPGDHETCSVAFADGRAGVVGWGAMVHGRGVPLPSLRRESVRVSSDGSHLLVNRHVYAMEGLRQAAEDEVIAVPAGVVDRAMVGGQKVQPKVFNVQGQYGPMTVALAYVGRDKSNGLTDEQCEALSLEEVQEWYTARGWPRAGRMTATGRRGQVRGYWQMV
jgi:hypothetical protein